MALRRSLGVCQVSELADVDLSVVAFLRQLSGRCSLPELVGKEDIVAP